MSERDDDRTAGQGRPLTTGEFRVAPDASANTAQFRAFASQQQAADAEAPWDMKAPGRNVGKRLLARTPGPAEPRVRPPTSWPRSSASQPPPQ